MFRQIVKMGKVKKISFHFEYPINSKLTLLPDPGIEPMSPALADGFFITEPLGS